MSSDRVQWDAITAFDSYADYEHLLNSLNELVKSGAIDSVPVARPYSGSTLWDEHWYRNRTTEETWRLVAPDPPFRGIFKKVQDA